MKLGDTARYKRIISEDDVYQFADITGDFNPLHIDKDKAKESIFGSRIVHGMLVASLVSTVIGMNMPGEGTIFMEQNSKFMAPVFIDDMVEVIVTCSEIINQNKNIVRLNNQVINQDGKLVLSGYSVVKVPREVLEV